MTRCRYCGRPLVEGDSTVYTTRIGTYTTASAPVHILCLGWIRKLERARDRERMELELARQWGDDAPR
jgi:hypothetical protein